MEFSKKRPIFCYSNLDERSVDHLNNNNYDRFSFTKSIVTNFSLSSDCGFSFFRENDNESAIFFELETSNGNRPKSAAIFIAMQFYR